MFLATQKVFSASFLPSHSFSHTLLQKFFISLFHFHLEIQHLPIFSNYYRGIQLTSSLYTAIHWGHICCTSTMNLG